MELFVDKEALKTVTTNLEHEIEQYKTKIDSIYREIDSLYDYWSGDSYQNFMEEISKNRNSIENSYLNLKEYYYLIHDCLNNYDKLSEGVHYYE